MIFSTPVKGNNNFVIEAETVLEGIALGRTNTILQESGFDCEIIGTRFYVAMQLKTVLKVADEPIEMKE